MSFFDANQHRTSFNHIKQYYFLKMRYNGQACHRVFYHLTSKSNIVLFVWLKETLRWCASKNYTFELFWTHPCTYVLFFWIYWARSTTSVFQVQKFSMNNASTLFFSSSSSWSTWSQIVVLVLAALAQAINGKLRINYLEGEEKNKVLNVCPNALCTIFTILLTLWNSKQKNGLLIKIGWKTKKFY